MIYSLCLPLTYFTEHNTLSVHPHCCKRQNFTLFLAHIPLRVCVYIYTDRPTSSLPSCCCWWAPRLLPCLGYFEWCYLEHWHACICLNSCFHFFFPDTYAGVEWILQFFCSKCVLIQSVAFTNGTRKVLEVGRAAPLMVSIGSTVVKVQGPVDISWMLMKKAPARSSILPGSLRSQAPTRKFSPSPISPFWWVKWELSCGWTLVPVQSQRAGIGGATEDSRLLRMFASELGSLVNVPLEPSGMHPRERALQAAWPSGPLTLDPPWSGDKP